jgi:hypothetical protein
MQGQTQRTSELLRELLKTANISQFIQRYGKGMETVPFHIYLKRLCTERDSLPAYIIKQSGIERTFGYQLFNGNRKPSRDKVIQLAFGFKMDYDEAQTMLKTARKSALYPKIKRDAVVIHALKRGLSLLDVQATLSELSLPLIGEVARDG